MLDITRESRLVLFLAFKKSILDLFSLYAWVFCLHVCVCTVFIPSAHRGQKTLYPLSFNYGWLQATMEVLEPNPSRPSTGATNSFSSQPSLQCLFFIFTAESFVCGGLDLIRQFPSSPRWPSAFILREHWVWLRLGGTVALRGTGVQFPESLGGSSHSCSSSPMTRWPLVLRRLPHTCAQTRIN